MTGDIEKVGSTSESSHVSAEKHPLEKMPSFEEHIKQLEISSSQIGISGNPLPRTSAIEPVLHGDGSEVHLEQTDLSLKSQERTPI